MKNRYEGGDLVVESLMSLGVEQIFSVSGGPLNSIYHAAANNKLTNVHTRQEQSACYMAEAAARLTGIPGVALVTLGPAVTNSVTAAFLAQHSGTPILIIGGQGNTAKFDRGVNMMAKHVRIMTPVTKFAARVLDTERIPEYIEMAWRHMWSGRPGPAFLEIPVNVLSAAAVRQPPAGAPAPRGAGLAPGVARDIAAALAKARRPLFVVGDETRWEMNSGLDPARVRAAIERHGALFTSLRHARGIVDERHEQYCGFGCVFSNQTVARAFAEADLVFLLGHHLETDLDFGRAVSPEATVVQCYPDVEYLGRNRRSDVATMAGVGAVTDALLDMEPMVPDRDWVAATAAAWRAEHEGLGGGDAADKPLHPVAVFDAVHAAMPEDTIYVAGMGNVDFWSDTRIRIRAPNSFIRCGQGGAVGPDVPYGIGARVACPDRPVVVFVGDGGFGYHGIELDTAERYGRPVIVVMMDDHGWGAIAMPQKRQYGGEFETDLAERDWAGFATALGGFGARAETVEEVGAAVRAAHASGKPALVQVPVRKALSPFMDAVGF